MTQAETDLRVTAHVGRALLAQAAQFKTEAPVAWEYVVNSLQYVDPGVQPKVEVMVKHGSITISDNGSGMDEDRLAHFFTLHGENLERRAGRLGRGKWGTGKSAAFGIANAPSQSMPPTGRSSRSASCCCSGSTRPRSSST